MLKYILASSIAAGFLILACGDDDPENPPPANDAGVVEEDTEPLDFYGGGCPSLLPEAASSCSADDRSCSYGSASRVECRSLAVCTDGKWNITQPAAGCTLAKPAECPKTQPTGACSGTLLCAYAEGAECQCKDGSWLCDVPEKQEDDCPTTPPNAGTVCSPRAPECAYGCGKLGTAAVTTTCNEEANVWDWVLIRCASKP